MDSSTIISFVVVVLFSIFMGLFFAWLFGSVLVPNAINKKREKRAVERIAEQKEEGYTYKEKGKDVNLNKLVEEGLATNVV